MNLFGMLEGRKERKKEGNNALDIYLMIRDLFIKYVPTYMDFDEVKDECSAQPRDLPNNCHTYAYTYIHVLYPCTSQPLPRIRLVSYMMISSMLRIMLSP